LNSKVTETEQLSATLTRVLHDNVLYYCWVGHLQQQ